MTTIFLVTGSAGSYSDRAEWPVKAFRDQTAAERFVLELQETMERTSKVTDADHAQAQLDFETRNAEFVKRGWDLAKLSWNLVDVGMARQQRQIKEMSLLDKNFYSEETSYNVVLVELVELE